MSNLIQLIIATILSSLGFAEDVEITSTKVGTESPIEIISTTVGVLLPSEEKTAENCKDIFNFSLNTES